jgi:hypothetical protein
MDPERDIAAEEAEALAAEEERVRKLIEEQKARE